MAESADSRPHFAHRLKIDRIEGANRVNVEVEYAAIPAFALGKFLIAPKHRAGDNACLKLKQHNRPRHGIQPGRPISKSPLARRQAAEETFLLHPFDAQAAKARKLVAHRQNPD